MRKFFLAAVLVLMASGAQAATLNVIDGILHGASGVDVGGALYDVEFLDGNCVDLFNGCDDSSDFTFIDEVSSLTAAQALRDQVFLDGPLGAFDSQPQLTVGCEHSVGPVTYSYCNINIPFRSSFLIAGDAEFPAVDTASFRIWSESNPPCCTEIEIYYESALSGPAYVFVRWTQVPEPSTALLLGVGLAGLAGYRRL